MVAEKISRHKRKGSDQLKGTSKKRKSSESDDYYKEADIFCEQLNKAGCRLYKGGHCIELSEDQTLFQRNLEQSLKKHSSYPNVTNELVTGFETYIAEPQRFHYVLLPTSVSPNCENLRSGGQDSLARLLLGIDIIQPKLMTVLLEKLPEFMGDDDNILVHGEKVNIPRMLLNQFRWLNRIVDSKELTQKILDMIEITSLDVQREIIVCLPDIVEDSDHIEVAKKLRDLLLQNNDLTIPILDALTNLSLTADLLSEVRTSVLRTLSSVELDDLPVVVKFLLQSITGPDAVEVIGEMRLHLDFHSGLSQTRKTRPSSMKKDSDRGTEALVLDAIKSGIRFQKSIAEAWIKVIDSVKHPVDHKEVDIFALLILHSANRIKPVESLFRNKIRSSCFTEALLQRAFGSHAEVLREYFPSILSLAEVLLRSPEPAIDYFAASMYKNAFVAFDTFCQQEVVGNIVTHIGSGFEGEIDGSLDILADLVKEHLSKMAPFVIFVKGVLDYMDNLSVTQIRKLYSMLSALAFRNPQDGGLIQDDLHIIIRKQLTNNNPKYKKMGVIGAIMVSKSIAQSSEDVQSGPLSEDMYKEVISLLQLVRCSIVSVPETACLFMDELSSVVANGQLNTRVENWINENVITDFQDDFVVDIEDQTQKSSLVPIKQDFGLDDDSEGAIAINMLPLVIKSLELKSTGEENKIRTISSNIKVPNPLCISPHFRLLRICEEKQHGGNLESIDALLGCPVFMPNDEVYDKMESLSEKEKEAICTSLFHCINWFREVVNGFATQSDPEMKGKVLARLQNLTDIQSLLEKSLAAFPDCTPPPANFDWDDPHNPTVNVVHAPSSGESKKKGKRKNKKKKTGSDKNSTQDDVASTSPVTSQLEDSQTETQNQDTAELEKPRISLSHYRPFLRELDLDVFDILSTGLITKASLDTDMNTKATTELTLKLPQLEFLLEDLSRKLSHSLIASTSKRKTSFKVKSNKNIGYFRLDQLSPRQVAVKAVKLLPALCDHLEGTCGFFQTLLSQNDGIVDGPGSTSPEACLMASCFNLLLEILLSIFSWNGFVMSSNRDLMREALNVLVSRIKSTGQTQLTQQDLIRNAFQYVNNFEMTVPSLGTAVTLIKLLITLAKKIEDADLTHKIAKIGEEFLKRDWLDSTGQREKGVKHNENLQTLLKTFLEYSEDPLTAAEGIATKGIPELLGTDKNGCSNTYQTLTRLSYPVYYRLMFSELVESIKSIATPKQADTKESKVDKLLRWNLAVRILHILVNLIKAFDRKNNLNAAMKYGRQFLEVFLRQCMPLLDQMFRSHREDVQGLLKNIQISTRAMHHVSSHSKIIKDITLTNQVPLLKKCLEAFVYRVKMMLSFNQCHEAFWMGNLKNRDLQGEEILSQVSTVSESTAHDEESDGETGLEDDDRSDVEMDNPSDDSLETTDDKSVDEGGSYSDAY